MNEIINSEKHADWLDYKKGAKPNYNKNSEELACYTCIYAPYAPACNNCLFDSNYIRRVKMNHKHGEKVIVYKFFQGVFTKEYGEKRINPYGEHGKFLGIIDIMGERRRSVQCSTKPGVIRNNFIWYPVDEENSELEALKIFKARENMLLHKAEMEIETRIEHEEYLKNMIENEIRTHIAEKPKEKII